MAKKKERIHWGLGYATSSSVSVFRFQACSKMSIQHSCFNKQGFYFQESFICFFVLSSTQETFRWYSIRVRSLDARLMFHRSCVSWYGKGRDGRYRLVQLSSGTSGHARIQAAVLCIGRLSLSRSFNGGRVPKTYLLVSPRSHSWNQQELSNASVEQGYLPTVGQGYTYLHTK